MPHDTLMRPMPMFLFSKAALLLLLCVSGFRDDVGIVTLVRNRNTRAFYPYGLKAGGRCVGEEQGARQRCQCTAGSSFNMGGRTQALQGGPKLPTRLTQVVLVLYSTWCEEAVKLFFGCSLDWTPHAPCFSLQRPIGRASRREHAMTPRAGHVQYPDSRPRAGGLGRRCRARLYIGGRGFRSR